MHSFKRRLSFILIACTILSVGLCTIFVNFSMKNTFDKYLSDVQDKRNARIVQYFVEVYKKDKKWDASSGEELKHEAYMSNFCLTLLDENKRVIWGMERDDIKDGIKVHTMMEKSNNSGVYTSKTYDIKVDGKIVGYAEIGQYYPVFLSEQDVNFKLSINKSIAISGIIVIAIVATIALVISNQFSRPIKKVSDTSVELSKGNYINIESTQSSVKEIANLINSTNLLCEKLKNQDNLRKRLISDVSHELRTPLNVLQNNLEAMTDGIIPVTSESLNNLNNEVIRFGKLLNNLNYLKESDLEFADLEMKRIELTSLVAEVCNGFSGLADDNGITIKEDYGVKDLYILGDEDKLKQVFINLLSNAIKFTEKSGDVEISIKQNKGFVVVQIKDNGIGISEQDLHYIFERFYRSDKSRNKVKGNGIGLSIVKNILRLHNAAIEVESVLGVGSKFQVIFNSVM